MAKLGDVAPVQKRVLIPVEGGEQEVDVRGLSLQDISRLIARFPQLVALLADGKSAGTIVQSILQYGPEAVAAVIASACGAADDARAEAVAAELSLGLQVEILAFVAEATLPKGVGPFEKLLKSVGLDPNTVRKAASSTAKSSVQSTTSSEPGTE